MIGRHGSPFFTSNLERCISDRNTALVTELRAALKLRDEAKSEFQSKKSEALEARAKWTEKQSMVEEIEDEIRNGKSGRAIIDKVGTVHTSELVNGTGNGDVAAKTEKGAKS